MQLSHDISSNPVWKPYYWAISLFVGLFIYAFEAIGISLYSNFRAPNVSLGIQLVLMLLFYSLWIVVPRITWLVLDKRPNNNTRITWKSFTVLGIVGLGISLLHLGFLAFIKLLMYSQVNWGVAQFLSSAGETWLGYSGLWLIIYALSCFVIWDFRSKLSITPKVKFEVRKNDRILSIAATEILWIEAVGNYVQLHTTKGMFTLRKSLTKFEKELRCDNFIRAHRQALINLEHVQSIKALSDKNAHNIEMSDGTLAPISRRKLSEFKKKLHAV